MKARNFGKKYAVQTVEKELRRIAKNENLILYVPTKLKPVPYMLENPRSRTLEVFKTLGSSHLRSFRHSVNHMVRNDKIKRPDHPDKLYHVTYSIVCGNGGITQTELNDLFYNSRAFDKVDRFLALETLEKRARI